MPTRAQLAANRANAKNSTGPKSAEGKARSRANAARSTGPRTPAGKARSRWNALRHGIRARHLIPEPLQDQESPEEFAAFLQDLRDEFAPATAFEETLVDAIAVSEWRLGRVQTAESRAIVTARNLRRGDLHFFALSLAEDAPPGAEPFLPEHITLPDVAEAQFLLRYCQGQLIFPQKGQDSFPQLKCSGGYASVCSWGCSVKIPALRFSRSR